MGMCYWPISGHGLAIDLSILDPEKLSKLMDTKLLDTDLKGKELEEEFWKYWDCRDVLEALTAESKGIGWAFDGDDEYFILYHALMPWEMGEGYKALTREQAEQNIIDLLKVYVKPGVDIDELAKQIDTIATYGAG
jgi:hypothetical protein